MVIYTSYYGNYRNFGNLFPISIALYPSRYFRYDKLAELAPTKEILSLKDNPHLYTMRYKIMLSKLDARKIYNKIESLSKGKDVVLLCYEKPPQFCHRHLVAQWLDEQLGVGVKELKHKF